MTSQREPMAAEKIELAGPLTNREGAMPPRGVAKRGTGSSKGG